VERARRQQHAAAGRSGAGAPAATFAALRPRYAPAARRMMCSCKACVHFSSCSDAAAQMQRVVMPTRLVSAGLQHLIADDGGCGCGNSRPGDDQFLCWPCASLCCRPGEQRVGRCGGPSVCALCTARDHLHAVSMRAPSMLPRPECSFWQFHLGGGRSYILWSPCGASISVTCI
jgi:hypothetical protein